MAMPQIPPRSNKSKTSLPAEDMNLLQEIDDTLRAERMAQIWKDFGGLIVSASIAILLATVGWVIWKNHMESANMESTSQMIAARDLENQGKYSDAAELYGRVAQANKNKTALLALYQADAFISAGQQDKAEAALQSSVSSTGGSEGLREFSRLKLGVLQADKDGKLLQEAAEPGKPFNFTAREIEALRLISAGKTAEAKEILTSLSLAPDAPFTIKQRAQKILGSLETPVAANTTPAKP